MSSVSSRKKRPGLLEVVNRLSLGVPESKSEQIECDEDLESTPEEVPEKRRASASSFHLAKSYVPPSSPQSCDSSDEAQEKEVEEVRKGPTEPMRCGVCGLRVYKSYRYISRSSAPNHLKNFFDPDTDRFRVCKRCHSSKERCRQNLSLLLLKSETEQYIHLRSPLGTTHHRRSHSMKFLTRDIGRSLKRPYEDLTCDETLDEDYLSDADENTLAKAMKKEPLSAKTVPSNGVEKSNGTGVVTVVRPNSNTFVVYPNHFTTYGEITKTTEEGGKTNTKTELTTIKIFNKKPEEKTAESEAEGTPENANGELKSEIRTINYKLTLLDHAYALPAAKNLKLIKTAATAKPVVPNKPPKIIKADSLAKTAIRNMIKNNSQVKKKEATSTGTSTENKDPPTRTCGIICSLCSNLVTKSYSCYRKENAPEKIRPLFTGDVKVMKVCRRCVPYKKPKGAEENAARVSKSKVKISMNKFIKQKVKNAKKTAKFEVKNTNNESSTQTKELSKSAQKPTEENGVNTVKQEPEKPPEKTLVQVPPKQDTKMVHVSIKNGKVESSTRSGDTLRNTFPPISSSIDKESSKKTHVLSTLQEKIVQSQTSVVFLKLKGLDSVTKQPAVNNLTSQVDFGTQPVQSMIGVKKNKQKTTKNENESKDELQPEGKEANKPQETIERKESIKENKDKDKVTNKDEVSLEEKQDKKDKIEGKKEDKEEELKAENKPKHTKENEMEKTQKALNDGELKTTEIKASSKPLKAPVLEPVRSSPRRDKNIVPPEKKKDSPTTDAKPTTVSTRKRKGVSESESESGKQNESKCSKQSEETANEKQSSNKTSEKAEASLKRSTRKGRGMKRKDSESSNADPDKKDKKTKADDAKDGNPSRSYSTRYGQSPTKCCCCSESSQKLFRCVQNGRSPSHIKPLFEREGTSTLRICRKCLNCRSRVKSFL